MTVSYTWLKGYGYEFLALFHAVTVIFTLLWLPFGKFFHIFQRPAQLGVEFYKDVAAREAPAHCRRCGHAFASQMHVTDLIQVERDLGYRYEIEGEAIEHYQWICPRCRRAMLALAQGRLRAGAGECPGAGSRCLCQSMRIRASAKGPSAKKTREISTPSEGIPIMATLAASPHESRSTSDRTSRDPQGCGSIPAWCRTGWSRRIAASAASSAAFNLGEGQQGHRL